jgi:hypothetical protein
MYTTVFWCQLVVELTRFYNRKQCRQPTLESVYRCERARLQLQMR